MDVLEIVIEKGRLNLVLCGEEKDINHINTYIEIHAKQEGRLDLVRLIERITNYTKLKGSFVGRGRRFMIKLFNQALMDKEAYLTKKEIQKIIKENKREEVD